MNRLHKFIVALVILFAFLYSAWYFDLASLLTVDALNGFTKAHTVWGPIVFVLGYGLAVVSFLPASPIAILGGALFGPWLGFIYVLVGATFGATVAFYIARLLGKSFLEKITHKKFKKVHEYNHRIGDNGLLTVLILRMIPFFPFKGPNYLFGLTKVKSRDYMLGTLIGIMPEALVFVWVGHTLSDFSFWHVTIISVLICVLFFVGIWSRKFLKKPTGKSGALIDKTLK